jgi:hypothetical protein
MTNLHNGQLDQGEVLSKVVDWRDKKSGVSLG